MISASIRFEGPTFFNIALQPYAEAGKHFRKALVCSEGPSLLGRVGHVGAGLFLMIPVVNSVFMAIILVGFKPREGGNLPSLLNQLGRELLDDNDPQSLINCCCPRSLFPEGQPQIDNLSGIQPVKHEDNVQARETYLLMLLCANLWYLDFKNHPQFDGQAKEAIEDQLCDAFLRLGSGWSYESGAEVESWEAHVNRIDPGMRYQEFYDAVRKRAGTTE